MTLPSEITSARLRMPLVTPDEAAGMRAGERRPHWHRDYPRPDDVDAATLVGSAESWGPRHLVRRSDGLAVGSIGCFGPPRDGETEIGFGLVEEARGAGLATEAVRALLVEVDRAGIRVRASVVPDNTASFRVLAKCGFTELRGTDDEGQLVLARPLPRG